MLERAFDGDGREFCRRSLSEGPARGCEPEISDRFRRLAVEALEDCGMLAVHGEDPDAVPRGFAHHHFARHDENFLRGHGDVLRGANRRQRRLQAPRAYDGDQDDVGDGKPGKFEEASGPERT